MAFLGKFNDEVARGAHPPNGPTVVGARGSRPPNEPTAVGAGGSNPPNEPTAVGAGRSRSPNGPTAVGAGGSHPPNESRWSWLELGVHSGGCEVQLQPTPMAVWWM